VSGSGRSTRAALVDIDGTLVDSNYQHALAWFRAMRRHGVTCEIRVLHHLVGMGGDQLVTAAAGEDVERRHGDALRDAEATIFREMIDERARAVVLSSSAKPDEAEHYVDLLDARGLVDGWTTSEDVDATKPAPDLIEAGLDRAGGGPALMSGDSTWDCRAAARAGVPAVAVLTGGYCREELAEAGAVAVFDTPADAADGIAEGDLLA
jgi:phosphoglycolate phosphatase-like HAD superfamily hydrolase